MGQLGGKSGAGGEVGEAKCGVFVHDFAECGGLLVGGVGLGQQGLGSGQALRAGQTVALGVLVELAVNG